MMRKRATVDPPTPGPQNAAGMEFALEATADGRRLRIDPGEPVVLKVRRGDQPGGEIVVGMKDGRPFLDNRSSAVCLVNGTERAAALLSPGDSLQLGAMQFRLIGLAGDVEVVEPPTQPYTPAQPTPSTDSDRQRQQRRISASRMASVDSQPTGTSGLLKRVSAAFTGRAEKQRLDQLEDERRAALLAAGRRSLADGSALGLPAQAMAALQRGQAVTLRPQDLEGLVRWREERQRLVRMDAEIAALRQALGLGSDPDAVVLTTPTLRSTEQARVERAFATMDEVGTQSIENLLPAPPPAPAAPPAMPPRRIPPRRR